MTRQHCLTLLSYTAAISSHKITLHSSVYLSYTAVTPSLVWSRRGNTTGIEEYYNDSVKNYKAFEMLLS